MKVLLDSRPTLGGIHRYTMELGRLLGERAREIEVERFGAHETFGRKVGAAGTGPPWPIVSGLRQVLTDQILLPRAIRRGAAALFHTTRPVVPLARTVPTVATVHDLWLVDGFDTKPAGWTRHYDRANLLRAVRRADHLVTVSRHNADTLIERGLVPPDRVTTIPPPLPSLAPRSGPKEDGGAFLLTVGTLEPRKNLERLLDAQARAFPKTGVPLWLVGSYGWRSRAVLARLPELGNAARWLGVVDDGRLARLYASATAVVQYSLAEGFDYPAAEALECGAPLVLSDIPVHRELAGTLALYADPMDSLDLAARLEEVSGWSPGQRAAHRTAAARVVARLRQDGRIERYLEVYHRALDHSPR